MAVNQYVELRLCHVEVFVAQKSHVGYVQLGQSLLFQKRNSCDEGFDSCHLLWVGSLELNDVFRYQLNLRFPSSLKLHATEASYWHRDNVRKLYVDDDVFHHAQYQQFHYL